MLEDLEEDAGLVDRVLENEKISFTRRRVDTRGGFIEALNTYAPDLILSDHALPQFNSIEALKITQERKMNVPFIIVTGAVSEEFAVNCLKMGADDYVLKSNLSRLPSAITHSLNEHNNLRVRKEQEETLLKQNKELNKINKELDSFVYSISHNLRAPVASIIGVAHLAKLDENKGREAVNHFCDLIEKSALKLDRTVKQIIHYSNNARANLVVSEIDLQEVCDECFKQLNYLNGWHRIEKNVKIKSESAFHSDRYRLAVLMTNLLSNAIKFEDEGKPSSQITVNVVVSSAQMTVNIFDNGVGIRPEILPYVFNMFYRGNEKSDGDGLGLYIVKEVVEKLKGTIDIKSEYGQWTRIDFSIPDMIIAPS